MTAYEPQHRAALLEAGFALDHLVWCYRSELDQRPHFAMTADDICLHDFANRTASLVRAVLDEDTRRRGPRPAYKPSENELRLRAAIEARRRARRDAERTSTASSEHTPEHEDSAGQEPIALVEEEGLSEHATARCRRRPR